jgi:hypothetical protein
MTPVVAGTLVVLLIVFALAFPHAPKEDTIWLLLGIAAAAFVSVGMLLVVSNLT